MEELDNLRLGQGNVRPSHRGTLPDRTPLVGPRSGGQINLL
jgi:hypothetical protein